MSHAFYAEHINAIKAQIKIVTNELNHLLTELQDAIQMEYDAYIKHQSLVAIAANEDIHQPATLPTFNPHPIGTKLVWTSNIKPDTHCTAIVIKDSKIIQIKSVTDGTPDVHKSECGCAACWVYAHDPQEPQPLTVQFFDDEHAWRQTLDLTNCSISAYPPPAKLNAEDALLKKLSCDPLTGASDGEKLKELEKRFPGGIFVLTTHTDMYEINTQDYVYADISYTLIQCAKTNGIYLNFKELEHGADHTYKPNLMVEWMGLYIGLEHLF